jgi:hypothetical protein
MPATLAPRSAAIRAKRPAPQPQSSKRVQCPNRSSSRRARARKEGFPSLQDLPMSGGPRGGPCAEQLANEFCLAAGVLRRMRCGRAPWHQNHGRCKRRLGRSWSWAGTLGGACPCHPAQNKIQPDHLPTPFSAADIRAGCLVGRTIRLQSEAPGGELSFRQIRFVEVDADGAVPGVPVDRCRRASDRRGDASPLQLA